jgi:hypothetical protein
MVVGRLCVRSSTVSVLTPIHAGHAYVPTSPAHEAACEGPTDGSEEVQQQACAPHCLSGGTHRCAAAASDRSVVQLRLWTQLSGRTFAVMLLHIDLSQLTLSWCLYVMPAVCSIAAQLLLHHLTAGHLHSSSSSRKSSSSLSQDLMSLRASAGQRPGGLSSPCTTWTKRSPCP